MVRVQYGFTNMIYGCGFVGCILKTLCSLNIWPLLQKQVTTMMHVHNAYKPWSFEMASMQVILCRGIITQWSTVYTAVIHKDLQ